MPERDITAAYHKGDENSVAAFRRQGEARRATQREKILAALVQAGSAGLTARELETATGLRHDCTGGRIGELCRDGKAHRRGDKRNGAWIVRYGPGPNVKRAPRRGSKVALEDRNAALEAFCQKIRATIARQRITGEGVAGMDAALRALGY